jgi:hypothetical protein
MKRTKVLNQLKDLKTDVMMLAHETSETKVKLETVRMVRNDCQPTVLRKTHSEIL